MALKKRRLAKWVIGVVRRDETAKKAIQLGALDMATKDLKAAVKDADLVILSGPVSVITSQLRVLSKLLKEKAIVIDVGSSKSIIEVAAKKYLKNNIFVGCHPMAGSEKTGVENSCPSLFERSVCFVTKSNAKINRLWRSLGSASVLISATQHDNWAAHASHLPHVLAFSIFQDLKSPVKAPLNPSLRSLGRLAKSDPMLWTDILLSNRKPMLHALNGIEKRLRVFRCAIATGNAPVLKRLIQTSNSHAV